MENHKTEHTWTEEYKKIDGLLHHFPHRDSLFCFEKQRRLLDQCISFLLDSQEMIPRAETKELLEVLDLTEGFIKDLYRLYRLALDENFYLKELSQRMIQNPYAKEESDDDKLNTLRNRLFEGRIRHLSYPELFNLYLFIDKLFEENQVLDWLDIVADWKTTIQKKNRFLNEGELFRPITSYFTFHKVIEAYYILTQVYYESAPNTPVTHLWDDDSLRASDPAIVNNPFSYLDFLLHQSSLSEIKENLTSLFQHAQEETAWDKGPASQPLLFIGYLKAIVETAFLITKSPYIPAEWLVKDKWTRPANYVEPTIGKLDITFLSKKERKRPFKTISKTLWSLQLFTETLDDWLYKALDLDIVEQDEFKYFSKINKIVEALYLVYRQLLRGEIPAGESCK